MSIKKNVFSIKFRNFLFSIPVFLLNKSIFLLLISILISFMLFYQTASHCFAHFSKPSSATKTSSSGLNARTTSSPARTSSVRPRPRRSTRTSWRSVRLARSISRSKYARSLPKRQWRPRSTRLTAPKNAYKLSWRKTPTRVFSSPISTRSCSPRIRQCLHK